MHHVCRSSGYIVLRRLRIMRSAHRLTETQALSRVRRRESQAQSEQKGDRKKTDACRMQRRLLQLPFP